VFTNTRCCADNLRQVQRDQSEAWAAQASIPFMETSAKNNTNVDTAFMKMVDQIFKSKFDDTIKETKQTVKPDQVDLSGSKIKKKPAC